MNTTSRKIISVVGARPQFIKAAVLARALDQAGARHLIIHTGQHYDDNMSAIFFDQLNIPEPEYNLDIGSGTQGKQTGEMLIKLEQVLMNEQPDWLVLYGDTNSTLAGALAAAKLHILIAHVEAGLRSFNRRMPEEINRILTDHLSRLLFAPTDGAAEHLKHEGVAAERIVQYGDVMYDAALHALERAESTREALFANLGIEEGRFVISTVHRAENTDDPQRLAAIQKALSALAEEIPVVLPLHPRTRKMLGSVGVEALKARGVKLVEPLDYLAMLNLLKGACLVVTDSGGLQKEAYMCGTKCVTLRDETEWVELVEAGVNRLVPPVSALSIGEALSEMLAAPDPDFSKTLYGDGRAGEAMAARLLSRVD